VRMKAFLSEYLKLTAKELEEERQSEFVEQVLITHTVLGKVDFPAERGNQIVGWLRLHLEGEASSATRS
jgi:hypothetical protein